MVVKRSDIIYVLSCIYIYIYIYSPSLNFSPVAPSRLIMIFSILYLIYRRSFFKMIMLFKVEALLSFIVFIFCCVYFYLGGANYFVKYGFIFIELYVTSYAISLYLFRNNIKILNILVSSSVIAVIITDTSFFFPSVRDFFNSILKLDKTTYSLFLDRGFGFANDLMFTYSVALGIAICLVLQTAEKNKKYYLLIPFFVLALAINARVGLIVVILYLLIKYLLFFNVKRFLSAIFLFIISFFLIYIIVDEGLFKEQVDSISLMFFWIGNLISGDSNNIGHFALIFGDFWFYPKDLFGLLLGTGVDYFQWFNGRRSDVGYVILINFGGLFFISLLFVIFLKRACNNITSKQGEVKIISLVYIISVLLINIKGNFFSYNPATALFTLLVMQSLFQNKKI